MGERQKLWVNSGPPDQSGAVARTPRSAIRTPLTHVFMIGGLYARAQMRANGFKTYIVSEAGN